MKYGLLIDFGLENCNFGDYAQTIAIEYIYQDMHIPSSDIVYLTHEELSTYDGEPLVLPYSYVLGYIMNQHTEKVMLSDKIIPIFLGVSIGVGFTRPLDTFTNPDNGWLELFRKSAPIGCRDEATHAFFEQLGIVSYLQSCITNVLPERASGNYNKVLLVDCPSDILPFIPENLIEKAEVLSNAEDRGGLSMYDNYLKIKRRYEYYRDNAALVVTSRYHVATPCNAMGVPSILTMRPFKDQAKDIRLDTINPGIQLVSKRDYSKVEWSKKANNSESLKKAIMEIAKSRIIEAASLYSCSNFIYSYYLPQIEKYKQLRPDDSSLVERLRNFVEMNYKNSKSGKFYIWAASVLLCEEDRIPISDIIRQVNPNLDFAGWIDTYKTGSLCNFPIHKPDEVHLDNDDFIIVATGTVIPFAKKRFESISLPQEKYHIFFDTMITNSDLEKRKSDLLSCNK